jgi:hypothetical protein
MADSCKHGNLFSGSKTSGFLIPGVLLAPSLKMEAVYSSETFVSTHKSTHYIPEDQYRFLESDSIIRNSFLQAPYTLAVQHLSRLELLTFTNIFGTFTQATIGSNTCCTLTFHWLKPGKRKDHWLWWGDWYPFLNEFSSREVYDLSLHRHTIFSFSVSGATPYPYAVHN